MDKLVMYLNRELAECKRELAEARHESKRDAIDGQAALDEANNTIARMRPVVEAADRMVTARAQEDVKAYRKALGDLVEAIHVKRRATIRTGRG